MIYTASYPAVVYCYETISNASSYSVVDRGDFDRKVEKSGNLRVVIERVHTITWIFSSASTHISTATTAIFSIRAAIGH